MKKIILIFLFIFLCGFKSSDGISIFKQQEGVFVVKVNTSKTIIEPYVSTSLETVKEIAINTKAKVVINAGFFDPKTYQTISYIAKNSKVIANPQNNSSLLNNKKLKPYLPKIFNRTEIRFYEDKTMDIVPHLKSSRKKIIHSIQAGPMIYPELRLKKEAFVDYKKGKRVRYSAGVLHPKARTIVGYRGRYLYLVIITNANPMSLLGASEVMQALGVKKAMAMDGGSSTSLYAESSPFHTIDITCAKDNQARRVKSALILK